MEYFFLILSSRKRFLIDRDSSRGDVEGLWRVFNKLCTFLIQVTNIH